MSRINRALAEFQCQHNHHPLRTERNLTPRQIFEVSPRLAEADVVDGWLFGVEEEGPVPDMDLSDCVVVPPVAISLSPSLMRMLLQIDPLHNDNNHGIDVYCNVRAIV